MSATLQKRLPQVRAVRRHRGHGVPDTLHDSLVACLDRLIPVKEVARIGPAIGVSSAIGWWLRYRR